MNGDGFDFESLAREAMSVVGGFATGGPLGAVAGGLSGLGGLFGLTAGNAPGGIGGGGAGRKYASVGGTVLERGRGLIKIQTTTGHVLTIKTRKKHHRYHRRISRSKMPNMSDLMALAMVKSIAGK